MFGNTYASIMASRPEMFQSNTLATLSAVAGPVGTGLTLYTSASNLSSSWSGSGQQAQGSQATSLISKGLSVASALTSSQQIINAGSTQLTNAKQRLLTLTTGATGEGFVVTPAGTTILGPTHWAKINALLSNPYTSAAGAALKAALMARAAAYNAQINLVVLQTNAADAQVALTLANSAVSILGALTEKSSSSSSTAPTGAYTSSLDAGSTSPIYGGTPSGGEIKPVSSTATSAYPFGSSAYSDGSRGNSSGLAGAGVGTLSGANMAGLGLTGAGASGSGLVGTGTAGLNTAALGGTAGTAGSMMGTGRGAVGAEAGAARGSGMSPGVMYGGAGAGGAGSRKDEDHDGNDWLAEDGDPWHSDGDEANDAGGVLA